MTTIIRVKRRLGEDPVEVLVLSCKRKKTEDNSVDSSHLKSFEYILNFSGTVDEKDDKIAANAIESYKNDKRFSDIKNKKHVPDIKSRQRKDWKEKNSDNRFTLLSCMRSSYDVDGVDTELSSTAQKNVTIVDVSKKKDIDLSTVDSCNDSFVYDLYTAKVDSVPDYNDLYMEHLLSVHPLDSELQFENEDYLDEVDPDEDDSNDENNWRNDYPDSDVFDDENDEDEDEDGDILTRRMNKFHIGDSYVLSSDSDEEKYLNYKDEDKYCYYEAEDLAGKRYARYKANALRQIIRDEEDDESDIE